MKITNAALAGLMILAVGGCTATSSEQNDTGVAETSQAASTDVKKNCYSIGKPTDPGGAYYFCIYKTTKTISKDVLGGLGTITTEYPDQCMITIQYSKEPPPVYWYTYFPYDCFSPPSSVSGGSITSNIEPPDGQALVISDFDKIVFYLVDAASSGAAQPWDPTGVYAIDIGRWVPKDVKPVTPAK